MKFIVSGKGIELTDALRNKAINKVEKLEKYFNPDTEIHITMRVQKKRQTVEVTVRSHGMVFRAEDETDDMYTSIDKVVGILEKQIHKNKTKLSKKLQGFDGKFKHTAGESMSSDEVQEEHVFDVIRSKSFDIKPMDVEEAILQMNMCGHSFFVFVNSDGRTTNVVYKRKDGGYGVIEPMK